MEGLLWKSKAINQRNVVADSGASQVALAVKNLPANAGDAGSTSGLGRPLGGGNDTPLQHSCLENSMGRKFLGSRAGSTQSMEARTVGHDSTRTALTGSRF